MHKELGVMTPCAETDEEDCEYFLLMCVLCTSMACPVMVVEVHTASMV